MDNIWTFVNANQKKHKTQTYKDFVYEKKSHWLQKTRVY